MRFMQKRRLRPVEQSDEDPLSGVANLFDLGLVFIVGLLVMFLGAYKMQDLLDEKSDVTITKVSSDSKMQVITKRGKKIQAMRVTNVRAQGQGQRLGTAYRLESGAIVYVPE